MELKDIVLQQGDMVYFTDETWHIDSRESGKNFYDIFENDSDIALIKIERPIKYETIYEVPKEILNKEEKEWLEHFLRPFRNKISWIVKYESYSNNEYIAIKAKGEKYFELPDFRKNTMYKGMKLNKEYTLKELGLFEGEEV